MNITNAVILAKNLQANDIIDGPTGIKTIKAVCYVGKKIGLRFTDETHIIVNADANFDIA